MSKDRIIVLQRQLSIAKRALENLAHNHDLTGLASEALENIELAGMGKTHAIAEKRRA